MKISFFYIRYGIFVIAITSLLAVNEKFIKYFFYCIFCCFLVLIFHGFYQYFFQSSDRISSFFYDEFILGSYLSRLWPIFFGLSIFIFNRKNKLFFIFILVFIFSEVLIFLSGDRSALFNINLSAVFVILFSQKLIKLRFLSLLTSILIIIVISFINPTVKERVIDTTLAQMNLNTDVKGSKIYIFSKTHEEYYISAYKMFLDNKIFGVGVKNFRNTCKYTKYYVNGKEACNTHPHNSYIQILSEIGIFGFLFLLTIFFYFCKYLLKHLIMRFNGNYFFNDFEICILSGILIYLWPIIPTGNVFSNWLNIAMILNLPFLIWSRKSLKKEKYL